MTFILTIIFLFFYYIRPQDFIGGVLAGERIVLPILGLAVAFWAIEMIVKKRRLITNSKDIFMLGLWGALVMSTLSVKWAYYTVDTLIQFGKVVLVYFLISNILDSRRKLEVFMWAIVILVCIVGILGILQYYDRDITGVGPFVEERVTEWGEVTYIKRIRGVGIFDTNQLAYLMGFTLPLAYALFVTARVLLVKTFLLIAAAIYAVTVYFTLSRGGMLAFIVSIGFLYLLRKGTSKKAMGIILAGLFAVFLMTTPTRLGNFDKADDNFQGRVLAWYSGSQMFKASPITGIGIKKFREHSGGVAPHNAYVEVLSEAGILGVYFWIGELYFIFLSLIKLMNRYQGTESNWIFMLAFCFLVCLFQFLASCCLSNGAYHFHVFMYVGIVKALEATARRQEALSLATGAVEIEPLIRGKDLTRIAGLVVVFLAIWKVVLMTCLL